MTMTADPSSAEAQQNVSTALSAVPFTSVAINDRFWSERIRMNRDVTIPVGYEQCKSTGRIHALRLSWRPGDEPVPHIFWDSDVAKWLEAASYSLATHPDPTLDSLVDGVIELLAQSQQPDGYINSYYSAVEPDKRWSNLRDNHELYCAGHLMEAAAAHFQATGKRSFLDVMMRYADYIGQVFGTGEGQLQGYCGHEEIELALIKLARVSGEDRYLRLAGYFVDQRGQTPHYFDEEAVRRGELPSGFHFKSYEYNQSHLPVRDQETIVGHSVRATYLYCAMADLASANADEGLKQACERIWDDLVSTKMYLTGGIGSSGRNEGFTSDYDLPNDTAYAETCAAIGLVFWAHRMLQLNCDSRYADVIERALYNGVISGVSLDGAKFFYENPLASSGSHRRQAWFGCACCPPNITRILASLGEYVYSTGPSTIAVHLYVGSEAALTVGDSRVTLNQETDYPWDGAVSIRVSIDTPAPFELKLRIPGWCRGASVQVNGEAVSAIQVRGYLSIEREWSSGDIVTLTLPMTVDRIYANPRVAADTGRVALQRGPLVYCLEAVDNGPGLENLSIPAGATFEASFRPDLLGGVVALESPAEKLSADDWGSTLYRTEQPEAQPTRITAIPYFAWENREPGEMAVWVRAE